MPASFPLTLAQFIDALPVKSVNFAPLFNNEASRTRGGQFIIAQNGPTLWRGTVTLGQCYNEDAAAAQALIALAQHAGASFLMKHPGYRGPRAQAGVNTGRLSANVANGREIQITGLPDGFILSSGDKLSWTYGTNPVRYAYHAVVFDRTSAGGTVTVEVQPALKIGSLVANAAIELNNPRFKAKIEPGTVKIGDDGAFISEGSSFGFMQVIGE